MKLLIIKAESDYFRFTDAGFETTSLQKASVYPLDNLEAAREKCEQVKKHGVNASLYLLNITEEPFEE